MVDVLSCLSRPVTSEALPALWCLWGIAALVYLPLIAHTEAPLRQDGTTVGRKGQRCRECPSVGSVLHFEATAQQYCSDWQILPHLKMLPCTLQEGEAPTVTWLGYIVRCMCVTKKQLCALCNWHITLSALLRNCRSTVYYINTDVWLPVW